MPRTEVSAAGGEAFAAALQNRHTRCTTLLSRPAVAEGGVAEESCTSVPAAATLDFSRLAVTTPGRLEGAMCVLGAVVGERAAAASCSLPPLSFSMSHVPLTASLRVMLFSRFAELLRRVEVLDLYAIGLSDGDVPLLASCLGLAAQGRRLAHQSTAEGGGGGREGRDDEAAGVGAAPPTLRRLKIGDNALTALGAKELAWALRGAARTASVGHLTQLHLGGNALGDAGVAHLSAVLPHLRLENLGLRAVGMGEAGARCLAVALGAPTVHLAELQLRDNEAIGDEGLAALIPCLPTTLVCLDLQCIGCSDAAAVALFESLEGSGFCRLKELLLDRNRIGDGGAAALGSMLSVCSAPVATISVEDNCVGPIGAQRLFGGLALNRTLMSLSLARNPIGAGAAAFVAVLCSLCPLISMSFSGCELAPQWLAPILRELANDDAPLKVLDMRRNLLGADSGEGVSALCAMLRGNATVTRLMFQDNEIAIDGISAIASTAVANKTLRFMVFGGQSQQRPRLNIVSSAASSTLNDVVMRNRRAWAARRCGSLPPPREVALGRSPASPGGFVSDSSSSSSCCSSPSVDPCFSPTIHEHSFNSVGGAPFGFPSFFTS